MTTIVKVWSQARYAKSEQQNLADSSRFRAALIVGALVCLSAVSGFALASAPTGTDDVSTVSQKVAPSRAIRLSSVEGQVRVVQDGQIIADPATANLPLFEGSQVITGNDGRAEIQLENGSVARLSPNSTLTFSVVQVQGSGTRTEVVLNGGLAYFELQPSTTDHSLHVSYGSASFAASSFSVIRVTLDVPPGDLAVFSGNVHLERGNALQVDVHGGESLSLDSGDATRYNLTESISTDSWDSWNADRDQVLNSLATERTSATSSYVGSQGVGMADLDANGNWYNVPGQGYIWSPYQAQSQGAGWDPYGFGRWVYYPRFGFVWASGYDWGYAPYQCGLWNYYDSFGWGWAPGMDCNPWWMGGGWGYGIGVPPRGYLPPRRPVPGPGRPHPVGAHGLVAATVIPVDRRHGVPTELAQPGHGSQVVMINGHPVEPLHPVAPRAVYERSVVALGNRSSGVPYSAGSHPVATNRPGTSGSRPSMQAGGGHSQPSGSSHASYSGGGGGAAGGGHASGGGGGGGGGSHK
jgi:hypothetical protein